MCEPLYKTFILYKPFSTGNMLLYIWVVWIIFLFYLVEQKYVLMRFKNSPLHALHFIGKFLCASVDEPLTAQVTCSLHSISDINSIYKFKNIWRTFARVKACTDGRTDRQTEFVNIFQLCWKLLKPMVYKWKYISIHFET